MVRLLVHLGKRTKPVKDRAHRPEVIVIPRSVPLWLELPWIMEKVRIKMVQRKAGPCVEIFKVKSKCV